MKKRTPLVGIGIALGVTIGVAGLFGQSLYSKAVGVANTVFPGQQAGPDNLYKYTVETKRSGQVYAMVQVDYRNAAAREAYLRANKAKAEALVRKGGAPVYVSVTFAKPVPLPDFEAMVKATGFDVEDYTLETQDQQGKFGTISGNGTGSKDAGLVDMERLKPALEKLPRSINGAVIINGKVPATREGLGRLLTDTRVYIADVVAAELMDRVVKEMGASPADIHIRVFSPYSFLVAPGP